MTSFFKLYNHFAMVMFVFAIVPESIARANSELQTFSPPALEAEVSFPPEGEIEQSPLLLPNNSDYCAI
jgi:hypothetical protein